MGGSSGDVTQPFQSSGYTQIMSGLDVFGTQALSNARDDKGGLAPDPNLLPPDLASVQNQAEGATSTLQVRAEGGRSSAFNDVALPQVTQFASVFAQAPVPGIARAAATMTPAQQANQGYADQVHQQANQQNGGGSTAEDRNLGGGILQNPLKPPVRSPAHRGLFDDSNDP